MITTRCPDIRNPDNVGILYVRSPDIFGIPYVGQWRNVAPVAPAGGAMRRVRQNFELKLFGCKNAPYVGQINVRWWEKQFWVYKKLQGAPKSSSGRKKPIRKTEKIVATFFLFIFFRRQ